MGGTVVRAFEIPVQHLEKDVKELLRKCWTNASQLANWAVHQLIKEDAVRLPGMTWNDLKAYTPPDLYALMVGRPGGKVSPRGKRKGQPLPEVTAQYPGVEFFEGAKGSVTSILQGVVKKYKEERYDVIWRRAKSPCTYRETYPWQVHNSMWKALYDSSGRACVEVSLPGTGRVQLPLRCGPEFGRQLSLFKELVAGDAPRKELVIRWQRCSNSAHRPTLNVGGVPGRVMVKMVAEVPVKETPGDRTLVLSTDPEAFWVAELDRRRAWVLNGDLWKRIVSRHDQHLRTLQRMSEDAKYERRSVTHVNPTWPAQQLRKWQTMSAEDRYTAGQNSAKHQKNRLESLSHKDGCRLDSFTHEAAAHLVGFCIRQKVGEVFYLDRDNGFIPKFPWHTLKMKLSDKLKAAGIAFYSESGIGDSSLPDDGDEVGSEVIDILATEEEERWLRVTRLREMAARKVSANRSRSRSHPAVSAPPAT